MRLAESDVRSALDLVWHAAGYTSVEPFPREFLERLTKLIPVDAIVGYHKVEVPRPWRVVEAVEIHLVACQSRYSKRRLPSAVRIRFRMGRIETSAVS